MRRPTPCGRPGCRPRWSPGWASGSATDPDQPHLRQLLDRLDPDPDRVAIRAAIQAGDEGRVRALVGALDGSKVPAWFAASVGYHRMVPFEDGVRLMAAAWRTHPADYLLAYRIAQRLWGTSDDRLPEMLTWARVAVALRPDSPFPHTLLSTAWQGLRNWGEAEASARRAVELGRNYPKYAKAHTNLGNVLLAKGDLDGAEASYRAALAIDPDAAGDLLQPGAGLRHAGRPGGGRGVAPEGGRGGPDARRTSVSSSTTSSGSGPCSRGWTRWPPAGPTPRPRPRRSSSPNSPPSRPDGGTSWRCGSTPGRSPPIPPWPTDLKNGHRYTAARIAVLAAAGRDEEMTAFGVEEWGHLTGLALKWLRADLALLASQAKDPKQWPEVRERLTHWKTDPDLLSVRDPAWLAAMPPADRKGWESLWADVDALLVAVSPDVAPPPRPNG